MPGQTEGGKERWKDTQTLFHRTFLASTGVQYIEYLNEEDTKEVVCKEPESNVLFRFGHGVESIKTVNILEGCY